MKSNKNRNLNQKARQAKPTQPQAALVTAISKQLQLPNQPYSQTTTPEKTGPQETQRKTQVGENEPKHQHHFHNVLHHEPQSPKELQKQHPMHAVRVQALKEDGWLQNSL